MSGINEFNGIQPEQTASNRSGFNGKFLFSFFLAVVLITGITALGFTVKRYIDDPYGALLEEVASGLNLNEQQKSEVDKIKSDVNSKIGDKKIKHVKNGKGIEMLFRADNFDRQKALEIANEQDSDNRQLAVEMVDKLEQLHGVLTSEQRNSAVDKVKQLHAKFKSMKKNNSKYDKK